MPRKDPRKYEAGTKIGKLTLISPLRRGWICECGLCGRRVEVTRMSHRKTCGFCNFNPRHQPGQTGAERYELDGVSLTVGQWADRTGITDSALRQRIARGWDLRAALTIGPRPVGSRPGRFILKNRGSRDELL